MVAPSHILFSSSVYLVGSALAGHPISIIEFALCVVFSVFPADLDTPNSVLGRQIKPVSRYIQRQFKHRGLTHSLWVYLLIIVTAHLAFDNPRITWAIGIGCFSHSFLDATTKQGVYLLYPIPFKFVLPCKREHRFTVLSKAEVGTSIFFFLISLCAFPFLIVKSSDFSGVVGTVQALMTNAKTEREKYDLERGETEWYLSLKGSKNADFSEISGDYYIIAGHGANGFVLEIDGEVVTACDGSTCDILIKSCQAKKGVATEKFKNYRVKYDAVVSSLVFKTQLSHFVGDRRYYLIGQLRHAQDDSKVGKLRKFKFARLDDFPNVGYFSQIDLELQLRILANAQFPDFPQNLLPKNEDKKDVEIRELDPLLDKWIPDF